MEITLSYEVEDYVQSLLYDFDRSKQYKTQLKKTMLYSTALILLITAILLYSRALLGLIFIGLMLPVSIWMYTIRLKQIYKKHFTKYVQNKLKASIGSPIKLQLNREEFIFSDHTGESKTFIANLDKVIETKDYYFIPLKTSGQYIIPKIQINIPEFQKELHQLNLSIEKDLDWKW